MKKTLFSKAVSLVATLALAVSALPVVSMAEDTAQTDGKVVYAHNWLLNEDGSVRDGIKAYVYAERDYTNEQYSNEFTVEYTLTAEEVSNFVDPTRSYTKGFANYLTSTGTDAAKGDYSIVKDTAYIVVDLGVERNINLIEFTPYDNGRDEFITNRIYVSSGSSLDTWSEITSGWTNISRGTTKSMEITAENTKTARYIKLDTAGWYANAVQLLTVKGADFYYAEDLLHKTNTNELKDDVKITVSHDTYSATAEPKLTEVSYITDGKYEIVYGDDGNLDKDKATSYVMEFVSGDKWVVADLGERKALTSVRTLVFPGSTVGDTSFPGDVEIQVSNYEDFRTYKSLVKSANNHDKYTWIEFNDDTASNEYRYVRVLSEKTNFGLTELQVMGYSLCSNSFFTNFEEAIISTENPDDDTLTRVSNLVNAGETKYSTAGKADLKYTIMPVDKLKFSFDGKVDESTVTNSSFKVEHKYLQNGSYVTGNVTDCIEVKDNTIYFDMYKIKSNALVTIELTSDIKANGTSIQPKTLQFRTALVAPLPQVEGKVIKNVAAGKNVYYTNGTTKTLAKWNDEGCHVLADNTFIKGEEGDCRDENNNDIIIDLGNEYEIEAFLLSNSNPVGCPWHIGNFKFYLSKSIDSVFAAENNKPYDFYSVGVDTKKIDKTVARYIGVDRTATGVALNEIAAFAYMPEKSASSVSDAYFRKVNDSKYTFNIEKDGTDSSSIFLARYTSAGKLVDITTPSNGNQIVFNSLTDSDGNAYIIKAFAWNSTTGLKPLTKAVVY